MNKSQKEIIASGRPSYRKMRNTNGEKWYNPCVGGITLSINNQYKYKSKEEAIEAARIAKKQIQQENHK